MPSTKVRFLLSLARALRRRICAATISGGGNQATRRRPPKGRLAVYVGGVEPRRRYMVPVMYFNHPLFAELLVEAEEEFGFQHRRGITIPCSVRRFERIQARISDGNLGGRRKFIRKIFWFL